MNRKIRRRLETNRKRKERAAKRAADPKRKRANVPEMGLPERLYQAYGTSADWKAYDGKNMPAWENLPRRIQGHWQAVAADVASYTHEAITETIHALVKSAKGDPVEDAQKAVESEGVIEVVEVGKK